MRPDVMRLLSPLSAFFRNLFAKNRVETDLTAEVNSYLELSTAAKVRDGLDESAARRAAAIELGGSEQVKEEVREIRLAHGLETYLRDLHFGLRSLGMAKRKSG